ncbi:hypothetical protein [Haladaptatus halobius]|nr:hypothetical protein [Haladaptatus halobius]
MVQNSLAVFSMRIESSGEGFNRAVNSNTTDYPETIEVGGITRE